MSTSLFAQQLSNGTHFSDGVRVGPIYGPTYSSALPGGNFRTPLATSNPADTLAAPGVLLGPSYTYFVAPYGYEGAAGEPSSSTCLRAAADVQDGFTTFLNPKMNYTGVNRVLLPQRVKLTYGKSEFKGVSDSVPGTKYGWVLDVPRCIMLTLSTTTVYDTMPIKACAYGYDAYGFPVVSSITLPVIKATSATVPVTQYQIFPKAMKVLLGVYFSGAYGAVIKDTPTNATVSIGVSDVLGLPYRVDNVSYLTGAWSGHSVATNFALGSKMNILGANATPLISTGQYFVPADDKPGNLATSSDVRGLFVLLGSDSNTTKGNTQNSNFNYDGDPLKANQLALQMYLPNANPTKLGVYTDPSQWENKKFPSDIQPAIGRVMLSPSHVGGTLNYVPLYVDTTAMDLFGVPQYCTDTQGTPFMVK